MKRRALLLSGLGGAGALVVGWGLMPPRERLGGVDSLPVMDGEVGLNGWIKIAADGSVLLAMNRSEMGQGVHTALAMLVAEELDVPLARVRLVAAGRRPALRQRLGDGGERALVSPARDRAGPRDRVRPRAGNGSSPRSRASSASTSPAARRASPTPGTCCAWPRRRRGRS